MRSPAAARSWDVSLRSRSRAANAESEREVTHLVLLLMLFLLLVVVDLRHGSSFALIDSTLFETLGLDRGRRACGVVGGGGGGGPSGTRGGRGRLVGLVAGC